MIQRRKDFSSILFFLEAESICLNLFPLAEGDNQKHNANFFVMNNNFFLNDYHEECLKKKLPFLFKTFL